MNTRPRKRSIVLGGRKTSISLEDTFWRKFRAIAKARRIKLTDLAGEIELRRRKGQRGHLRPAELSNAIRSYIFEIEIRRLHQTRTDLVFARRGHPTADPHAADQPARPDVFPDPGGRDLLAEG